MALTAGRRSRKKRTARVGKVENPYIASAGIPKLTRSVVAVIDILGYKQSIYEELTPSAQVALLRRLRRAFDAVEEYLYDTGDTKHQKRAFWVAKAFTDNIVIGCPVHDDAESEMGIIFSNLSWLQMEMVREGLFLRGGLAVGDLYMDGELVFGRGLLEAYEAESTMARDPRIVLAASARKYVRKHIGYYVSGPEGSPQYRDLLRDSDGQVFLNYLSCILDDDPPAFSLLSEHGHQVREMLNKFQSHPLIWSKYLWTASYHNFFCEDYGSRALRYRLKRARLLLSPKKIEVSEL